MGINSEIQLAISKICQQSSVSPAELLKRVQSLQPDITALPAKPRMVLPEIYRAEQDIGYRRDNGGHRRLRKLKPIHKKIIALHLSCWTNIDIAAHLDLCAGSITDVIMDPLAQDIIRKQDDIYNAEFARLKILANQTIRDGMQGHKSDATRLKAAALFDKREANQKVDNSTTAEDVMAKILANIRAENIQVNVVNNFGDKSNNDNEV